MNQGDLTFTVVESNVTKDGDYHTKFQFKGNVSVTDDFATTTVKKQVTFYRFTDTKVKIGASGKIDFTKFEVELRPWTTPDGEELMLKYLKPIIPTESE